MLIRVIIALSLVSLQTAGTFAEDAPLGTAPPPELERLASLLGVWDTTTVYRFTPDAETYKERSVRTVHWSPNRQFIISDQLAERQEKPNNKLVITTWDSSSNEYRMIDLSPSGEAVALTMTIDRDVRTILYYPRLADRLVRAEITMEFVSPAEYRFRCKYTDQANTWIFAEGSSKKRAD